MAGSSVWWGQVEGREKDRHCRFKEGPSWTEKKTLCMAGVSPEQWEVATAHQELKYKATEGQQSHPQTDYRSFQLDHYLTFRSFGKTRNELRSFSLKNKNLSKYSPYNFSMEMEYFLHPPWNASAVISSANPQKCGSGHTLHCNVIF